MSPGKENEEIAFVLPREGFSVACDDLVIPRTARQIELAHRFINFLCDPEVAAKNTEFITYLAPNRDCYPLLSEEIRSNPIIFPPAEVRDKGEMIDDLGKDNAKYIRIWDKIKAAP